MNRTLGTVWGILRRSWMKFAAALGWFNTRLLLTVVYMILFGLGAVVLKILRKDLLRRKPNGGGSYWTDKPAVPHTEEHARHQF